MQYAAPEFVLPRLLLVPAPCTHRALRLGSSSIGTSIATPSATLSAAKAKKVTASHLQGQTQAVPLVQL
jgi:hypothetical protein